VQPPARALYVAGRIANVQRFRNWVNSLAAYNQAATTVSSWVAISIIATGIVSAATWVPGLRDFFDLPPRWALTSVVFVLVGAGLDLYGNYSLIKRGHVVAYGFVVLASSGCILFFSGFLMIHSSPWGAAVFSGSLLLTALFHGYVCCAVPSQPFYAVMTACVVLVTVALGPTRQHLATMLVIGPMAVFGSMVMGDIHIRTDRMRAQTESLRAAVSAQVIREQAMRADTLADTLEKLSMWNHDMRNTLTVARGHCKLLATLTPEDFAHEEASDSVSDSIAILKRQLDVLAQGLDETRVLTKQHFAAMSTAETVDVLPVAQTVASAAKIRFPSVDIRIPPVPRPARARLNGGQFTLHRAIENLVVNACEGDGKRGARHVDICLEAVDGVVTVQVLDDGPGFSEEQLRQGIVGLQTSKPQGTGLGLYTVEHLVTASGGALSRANRDMGGAVVTLRLPTE